MKLLLIILVSRENGKSVTPHQPPLPEASAHDVVSYQNQLWSKLAQLTDFVETQMTEAAHKQKLCYDQNTTSRSFTRGDSVWLTSPTAGKLDPKWEGDWEVQAVNEPTAYTIIDGKRTKTVHVNRLQSRIQRLVNGHPHLLNM